MACVEDKQGLYQQLNAKPKGIEQNRIELFQLEWINDDHPVQVPDHCRGDQNLQDVVKGIVQTSL